MFMHIETTRFGALDIDERKVLTFPDGLPGFEGCRQFALVPHAGLGQKQPLCLAPVGGKRWPWPFWRWSRIQAFPDYAPRVPRAEMESLELTEETARPRLYSLLTVPVGDPCGITANLMAPVVVNPRARLARQVVLNTDQYGLRHRLLPGD